MSRGKLKLNKMRKLLLFTIVVLSTCFVNAQWVRQIGETGNDDVKDCILDKNKNLYVTGSYQGTVDFGNGHINSSVNNTMDFFTAKYDENNNCLWTTFFGTTYEEKGIRIFLDTIDGSIYSVAKYGGDPNVNIPSWGFFKNNSNGTESWYNWITEGQNVVVYSDFKQTTSKIELLILSTASSFTIESHDATGTIISNTPFTFPFSSANGSGGVLHLILNKSNGSIYASHIYSYSNAFIKDAKFDGDSIIIAGGFTGSTQIGTFSLSATMGMLDGDGFLASINPSGNCNWAKKFSQGTIAETDEAAGILVVGSKIYFFNSILSTFNSDGFLCYYDRLTQNTVSNTSGTISYAGSTFYTPGFKTSKIKNDKMLISAFSYFMGCNFSEGSGVNEYDMNSLTHSTLVTFPSGSSVIRGSFASDSTSLYIVGAFAGSTNFDGTILSTIPSNVYDGYIFKKNYTFYPTSIPSISQNNYAFTLYPNPTNGILTVSSNGNINSIVIYNVLGELIYSVPNNIQLSSNEIDLSNFPKGIYFVKIYDGEKTYAEKIVKQ